MSANAVDLPRVNNAVSETLRERAPARRSHNIYHASCPVTVIAQSVDANVHGGMFD